MARTSEIVFRTGKETRNLEKWGNVMKTAGE